MGFRLLSGETRRALSPSQALPMSAVDQVTSSSNFLSPFGLRRNAMSEGAIQSPTLAGSLTPPLARLPVTPPPRKPASGQEQGMNEEEDEGIGFSVSPPSPTCTMVREPVTYHLKIFIRVRMSFRMLTTSTKTVEAMRRRRGPSKASYTSDA